VHRGAQGVQESTGCIGVYRVYKVYQGSTGVPGVYRVYQGSTGV
jgi:hypothetical protein